ncbi:hypothetical protein [Halobacteriovorax sp. JY17]|uniref:RNA recognition motif domain-containing protein n=1 Tax=Halobacteriovorax sp. JY17 TaxID=2014617 RepID=UPI0025C4E038|nr:hypothetical protein [Halobacteriovorax sp. JY17]
MRNKTDSRTTRNRPNTFTKAGEKPSAPKKSIHITDDITKPVVYIGNMSYKRNDFGILKLFKPFGYVVNVNLIQDEKLERSKGIAFVEMQTIKAAKDAVKALNGTVVDERTIKVSIAEDRIHPEHIKPVSADDLLSKGEKKAKLKKEKSNNKAGLHNLFNHLSNK